MYFVLILDIFQKSQNPRLLFGKIRTKTRNGANLVEHARRTVSVVVNENVCNLVMKLKPRVTY